MPMIRIELASDRERARKFHSRISRGEPFIRERDLVLDEVWAKGHTPTGRVYYRGLTNGQPPDLKFDAEITLE